MSENSDAAKSARERYIRVAAMDIMASPGTWNIYVDKMTQYQLFLVVGGKKTYEIEWLWFLQKN